MAEETSTSVVPSISRLPDIYGGFEMAEMMRIGVNGCPKSRFTEVMLSLGVHRLSTNIALLDHDEPIAALRAV